MTGGEPTGAHAATATAQAASLGIDRRLDQVFDGKNDPGGQSQAQSNQFCGNGGADRRQHHRNNGAHGSAEKPHRRDSARSMQQGILFQIFTPRSILNQRMLLRGVS